MSFFCLYCLSELPSNNPHGCEYTTHNFRTVVPKKDLSALTTAISADTCHTVTDFNPSTRRVSFDCILNTTRNELYVIVRSKLAYQAQGPGHQTWASEAQKETAKLALENCVSFWDGRFTIRRTIPVGTVDYRPIFFLDTNAGYWGRRIEINVQPSAQPVVVNHLVTVQCNAYVPTGTNYQPLTQPAAGTKHYYTIGVTQYSPQCTPEYDNQAACPVRNPAAHEYGHMIGLPDEYLVIQSTWAGCASDSDRAGYLWRTALGVEGIAVPANTGPNNPDNSIMNNVDIRPGGFHSRHFVTVLQAARFLGQREGLAGTWSIV